ncbi:Mitotic spindle checkpoint component mad2 [Tulasnella sp. JGI-2019a]|nr:Mitotic spindle checkpoint component mad2 [Tulasnella sp. JGI-2019a]KAG9011236.1 Mitotic spindle checkpoint component mad2 [Tulasnella sp. JGI-2019a]KAG9035320.1 Mitotic spindle checkpoint component mad2 [Tulasnella sp. JGI-2019a]
MATAQKSRSKQAKAITLKGSTEIVTDFFKFATNAILYHRNVYPTDDFQMVKKYGQVVLVTQDLGLERYIDTVLTQVKEWLASGSITQLVIAIVARESKITLERWVFDIKLTLPPGPTAENPKPAPLPPKPESEIQAEIRGIIKQIISSNTFLPTLNEPTYFTVLAYTNDKPGAASTPGGDPSSEANPAPALWIDSDPLLIEQGKSQQVRLKSFDTKIHKIEAMVSYRHG